MPLLSLGGGGGSAPSKYAPVFLNLTTILIYLIFVNKGSHNSKTSVPLNLLLRMTYGYPTMVRF